MPNLLSLLTCCVGLVLRPLPSTSVTRLQRYYGPIRHPKMPSLCRHRRLVGRPRPHRGVSRVARVFLNVCMLLPLPRCSNCVRICSNPAAVSVFPERVFGSACTSPFSRIAQHSLALRPAHSRRHQFVTLFTRRLQPFRYLHDRSGCFRLEPWPGGILYPQENGAFSRRTPNIGIFNLINRVPFTPGSSAATRKGCVGGVRHPSKHGLPRLPSQIAMSNHKILLQNVSIHRH